MSILYVYIITQTFNVKEILEYQEIDKLPWTFETILRKNIKEEESIISNENGQRGP